jgi:2-succinyl-6-hydroxy-2,4-cyclohexadiene-1-carboxylate synthase
MPEQWQRVDTALAAQMLGDDGLRSIAFLHGFTQTGNSWKPIAERLVDRGFRCMVVDLPGHGESSHIDADLVTTANLVADTVGPTALVGYSLGGRTALHVALQHPQLVRHLVVIGANPGIATPAERVARRDADEALARHLESIGVDRFLEEWLQQPLFAGLTLDAESIADRRRNTVEGLATSLRRAGTGTQDSLWPRLPHITAPLLALAGEHDLKFAALARELAAAVPDGHVQLVADATHACHLQQPAAVAAAIEAHLDH